MFVCDYVVVFSLVVLVAAGVLRWWLVAVISGLLGSWCLVTSRWVVWFKRWILLLVGALYGDLGLV